MPTAKPLPKTDEIKTKIDSWLAGATGWLSANDLLFKTLWRDAEQLANADALGSSGTRALIAHLAGDLQQALYWANNLRRLGGRENADELTAVIHTNLGYFSSARAILASNVPLLEDRHNARQLALACGAFDLLAQAQADRLSKDPPTQTLMNLSTQALQALRDNQVSPDHLLKVLDLAGEVLRSHRVFFATPEPILHTSHDGLLFEFAVGLPAPEVMDMTNEVLDRMIAADLDSAALAFSFIPTA